jgi:hypothetical protein
MNHMHERNARAFQDGMCPLTAILPSLSLSQTAAAQGTKGSFIIMYFA